MEIVDVVGITLGSSVFAAVVTAFFTRKAHEETVALKYITEERAKWREKIKETMANLNEAINSPKLNGERLSKTRKASTYLKLSLNPDPKHVLDNEILTRLKTLCAAPCYTQFPALEEKVSLLLKHDWERAKNEATTPLSTLVLFTLFIGLVWCVFYFIISNTSIYSLVQKVPHFAGTYSEIALSLGIIAISAPLLSYGKNKFTEYILHKKIIKLNEA